MDFLLGLGILTKDDDEDESFRRCRLSGERLRERLRDFAPASEAPPTAAPSAASLRYECRPEEEDLDRELVCREYPD